MSITIMNSAPELRALLRLQSWLSPALPIGAYSYSHGIEWAVGAGEIHDRDSLADWLSADLRFGTGRNDAIFFGEAWRCVARGDADGLLHVAELAGALRGTAELALESSQQAIAGLTTLRRIWPDASLEWLDAKLREAAIAPALSVVFGARASVEKIPLPLALAMFIQSYLANLISAGVRLIPLGQTDGQRVVAVLEECVLLTSEESMNAGLGELGSCAFRVDLASMAHESQYTRLFRS